MTGDLGNSLDLPFEESPRGELHDEHVHYASGVVVMAAVVPVPEVGPKPAVVFRFANPDGTGFYPPIVLVADDEQLAKLRPLIVEAVQTARRHAKGATS